MRAIISEALRKVLRVIYKGRGGRGLRCYKISSRISFTKVLLQDSSESRSNQLEQFGRQLVRLQEQG